MLALLALASAASLLAGACSKSSSHELAVDVRTDFRPGIEFTAVRTRVSRGGAGVDLVVDRAVDSSADALRGFRVSEFQALPPGSYNLTLSLLDARGAPLVSRRAITEVAEDLVFTIILTRDCRDVRCPFVGSSPSDTECLGGRCVPAACSPAHPELCGSPECVEDTDCTSTTACVVPRCVEGSCFESDDERICAILEYCDPERGCVPRPSPDGGTPMDAGGDAGTDTDAGADAGTDAGADAGTDAGTDTGTDAGTDAALPGIPSPVTPYHGLRVGSALSASAVSSPLRPAFRWAPAINAERYELQITDECDRRGYASCAFSSPISLVVAAPSTVARPTADLSGGAAPPFGRRHYWRVRACRAETCSAYSPIRYFDVGTDRTDFDADGAADVAVGGPYRDEGAFTDSGFLTLFRGEPRPEYSTLWNIGPERVNPLPANDAYFGAALAACDVNDDGFADLLVGAHGGADAGRSGGVVFVYLGSAAGVAASPAQTIHNPSTSALAAFGQSLDCAGDVDGDGYADVIVGAAHPGATSGPTVGGVAYVFLGRAGALEDAPTFTFSAPVVQVGAEFGAFVAGVGDADGDGLADVVVGAPYEDTPTTDAGAAYFFSSRSLASSTPTPVRLVANVGSVDARFGFEAAGGGDLNGDGYADLVVGAAKQSDVYFDAGAVFIYRGGPDGPRELSQRLDGPARAGDWFGHSVALVHDLDGDGDDELAVAATHTDFEGVDSGSIYVFRGVAAGVATVPDVRIRGREAASPDAHFGFSVRDLGDLKGDGRAVLGAAFPWGGEAFRSVAVAAPMGGAYPDVPTTMVMTGGMSTGYAHAITRNR